MDRKVYRELPVECKCGFSGNLWGWMHQLPLPCPSCKADTTLIDNRTERSAGVVADGIPGGVLIPHAICNPDGSPKRYDSHTEIKRALNKAGYTIAGDTPKPYRV